MKFANTDIVFQEIPSEVSLAINISNCPCHCPGCHSAYLWEDKGEELTEAVIDSFVKEYDSDITCISFMGGDIDPKSVNMLAQYVKEHYPSYKVGWYTGRTIISSEININNFDYIKVGPFIKHLGPLKNPRTNQRMYRVNHATNKLEDITSVFWKK